MFIHVKSTLGPLLYTYRCVCCKGTIVAYEWWNTIDRCEKGVNCKLVDLSEEKRCVFWSRPAYGHKLSCVLSKTQSTSTYNHFTHLRWYQVTILGMFLTTRTSHTFIWNVHHIHLFPVFSLRSKGTTHTSNAAVNTFVRSISCTTTCLS